jgi:aryl-alcohol dehydrogenase-like predicted oxidoreductase
MYPTNPVRAETVGDTERILGSWIEKTGRRNDLVIATKITGKGGAARDGGGIDPESLREAVEGSLQRLKTDVIDLYQFHWPNRGSYHFRKHWGFDPTGQDGAAVRAHMDAVAGALADLVTAGKIRAFGLSNESAWGTMQWIAAAERAGGPRVASIQNEYSLLCRHFDTDLAETCHHEEVTLLAFSPLAAGLLSGKYQDGRVPEGSRMSVTPELGGRKTERAFAAIQAYLDVARRHGLDPCAMALAWIRSRPVPSIPILGATSLEQLDVALSAADLTLDEDLLEEIAATYRAHPMPY